MTAYLNPLGSANPFLATQPIVFVVRHVRQTSVGEIVVENANNLVRHFARIDAQRVFPIQTAAPTERNVPEHGRRKKGY